MSTTLKIKGSRHKGRFPHASKQGPTCVFWRFSAKWWKNVDAVVMRGWAVILTKRIEKRVLVPASIYVRTCFTRDSHSCMHEELVLVVWRSPYSLQIVLNIMFTCTIGALAWWMHPQHYQLKLAFLFTLLNSFHHREKWWFLEEPRKIFYFKKVLARGTLWHIEVQPVGCPLQDKILMDRWGSIWQFNS